jgi:pyruvate dehydrogenase E2 component (dihydrolipoamide acetyltransferase)
MPSLGADMEAGTLVRWRVAPGDVVARGDVVCEVETDKGVIEVQTFTAGRLQALVVQPGAHVPVGTVLARFGEGGESVTASGSGSAKTKGRAPAGAAAAAAGAAAVAIV